MSKGSKKQTGCAVAVIVAILVFVAACVGTCNWIIS